MGGEMTSYLSALVTVELCYEVHRNGRPNTAIKRCVTRLLPGLVEYPRVYRIFSGLMKQAFPSGALHMLRRSLEDMAGGKVVLDE